MRSFITNRLQTISVRPTKMKIKREQRRKNFVNTRKTKTRDDDYGQMEETEDIVKHTVAESH